jgi:hypothetical protein
MPALPVNQAQCSQTTSSISPNSVFTPAFTLTSATVYFLIQNRGDCDLTISYAGSAAGTAIGFLLKPGASMEFNDIIPLGAGSIAAGAGTVGAYTIMTCSA